MMLPPITVRSLIDCERKLSPRLPAKCISVKTLTGQKSKTPGGCEGELAAERLLYKVCVCVWGG